MDKHTTIDLGARVSLPGEERTQVRPIMIGLEGRIKNQHFALSKKIVTIGRDMSADILLMDSDTAKRHSCVIYANIERPSEQPECRIYDGGITSGTFVNGERVGPEGILLRERDQVRVGKSVLGFFIQSGDEGGLDRKIEEMATRDQVTGLLNLRLFKDEVEREMSRAGRHKRPLSLLLIEIDSFREVYDRLGYKGGNEVLKQFSDFLSRFCRPTDVASRLGDSKILILLPETNGDGARVAAERIVQAAKKEGFKHGQTPIDFTLSMGVVEWDWAMRMDDFIEHAERTLRQAQQQGPGSIACQKAPILIIGRSDPREPGS